MLLCYTLCLLTSELINKGLTTKEQAGVVKEAVRSVVYDADSRMLKINRIESLVNGGGAARGSD